MRNAMTENRVAIYLRLSKEDIDKKDFSESIQNQRRMLLQKVQEEGWSIFDIYIDEDYSGIDRERPAFLRMLKDCEQGKIDIVLCKSQSRFSRDLEIIEQYIHNKFKEWNVRFISLIDHADTSVEENKKSRQINALMNEWYLEDSSMNIRKTLRNKKEAGLFTGSFAPFGYQKKDKNHLEIDPIASKYVQQIYALYVKGYGYSKIKQYLNHQQVPTPSQYKKEIGSKYYGPSTGNSWSEKTIADILKNEVYIGSVVQGKYRKISYKNKKVISLKKKDWIVVPHQHKPIISLPIWNEVQKRIHQKIRIQSKTGKIHELSKKIYCQKCGQSFEKNSSGRTSYSYLVCRDRRNHWQHCDNRASIRLDVIESLVLKEFLKFYHQFADEQLLLQYENQYSIEQNLLCKQACERLENDYHQKERTLKKLYEDYIHQELDDEVFQNLKKSYVKELEQIKNTLTSMKKEKMPFSFRKRKPMISLKVAKSFIQRIQIGNMEHGKRVVIIEWIF